MSWSLEKADLTSYEDWSNFIYILNTRMFRAVSLVYFYRLLFLIMIEYLFYYHDCKGITMPVYQGNLFFKSETVCGFLRNSKSYRQRPWKTACQSHCINNRVIVILAHEPLKRAHSPCCHHLEVRYLS